VEERLRGILEEKLAQLRVRRRKPPREQEPDPPAEPKPAESEDLGERLKRTGPEV
jgi:hypothetical protein